MLVTQTIEQEPVRGETQPSACPYLGIPVDPKSHYAYACPGNHCHWLAKPRPVLAQHQHHFCLTEQHAECALFRDPGAEPGMLGRPPRNKPGWVQVMLALVVLGALLAMVYWTLV